VAAAAAWTLQSVYGTVFAVDDRTGDVTVRSSLDYELQRHYSLSVVASDCPDPAHGHHAAAAGAGAGGGAPGLSSRVQVLVHVSDVNDCPPSISVNSLSPLGLAEVRSTPVER